MLSGHEETCKITWHRIRAVDGAAAATTGNSVRCIFLHFAVDRYVHNSTDICLHITIHELLANTRYLHCLDNLRLGNAVFWRKKVRMDLYFILIIA